MQYAIQTRDYNNDYHWNWEARGRDNPLAEASQDLLRLIRDGEKGVAVLYKNEKFHVIFAALDSLGSEPISKDFSGANIRLNLVFAELSQEQAKGLVQYYIAHRVNPGIAFQGIVTWDANSWKINETLLLKAFESIKPVSTTGKKLLCQDGNGKPIDWFGYDLSDETEGPKLVMQGDTLSFAADPIPNPQSEIIPPTKESGKKTESGFVSLVSTLLILALGVATGAGAMFYVYHKQGNPVVKDGAEESTKIIEDLQHQINIVIDEREKAKQERNAAQDTLTKTEELLNAANQAKEDALAKVRAEKKGIEEKLNDAIEKNATLTNDLDATNTKLKTYKNFEDSLLKLEPGVPTTFKLPLNGQEINLSRNRNPKE